MIPTPAALPERPIEIHAAACEHCPSMRGDDPESEAMKSAPRAIRAESAFPCAWRPEKLCRGYCNAMRLDDSDFDKRQVPLTLGAFYYRCRELGCKPTTSFQLLISKTCEFDSGEDALAARDLLREGHPEDPLRIVAYGNWVGLREPTYYYK